MYDKINFTNNRKSFVKFSVIVLTMGLLLFAFVGKVSGSSLDQTASHPIVPIAAMSGR